MDESEINWAQRTESVMITPIDNFYVLFFFFFLSPSVESIKSILGRHCKILVKYMIKLELKADKAENRVLVSKIF